MEWVIRIFFALVGGVFAFMGLYFLWRWVRDIGEAIDSYRWKTAPGVIEHVQLPVDRKRREDPDAEDELVERDDARRYQPDVRYHYEWQGREIQGTRMTLCSTRQLNEPAAQEEVWKYPEGTAVSVYVNPVAPERSVLHNGLEWQHLSSLILSCGFIFMGSFVVAIGVFGMEQAAAFIDIEAHAQLLFRVVTFAGLGLIAMSVVRRRNANAMHSWPTVTGRIVSSKLLTSRNTNNTTTVSTAQVMYRPEVRYTYEVDGRKLTTGGIAMGEMSTTSGEAEAALIAQYPVGKEVTVYYDPKRPYVSVLQPGEIDGEWLFWLAGIAFTLVGALFWRFW